MNVEEIKKKINEDRERLEASFVFCLYKNPTLYDDYKNLHEGTLITTDAKFYYLLGRALRDQGLNTIDNLSMDNFLSTKPEIKKKYDDYGGWKVIEELKNLTNEDNVAAYFDQINKCNYLINICEKYTKVFDNIPNLKKLSAEDMYMMFDNINTSASLVNNQEVEVQDLTITDDDVQRYKNGEAVGYSFAKAFPLLNYTMLGLPKGDITLLSGHSGTGKSSLAFYILLALVKDGRSVGVLSNEMQIDAYKNMLLAHVLTEELDYYKLTRKKLKQGGWSEEEEQKVKEAQQIVNEKYGNKIFFVKLFGNNSSVVMREMKRLNRKHGVEIFCWDTYKGDDTSSDKMWQELLMNSRKVFNLVAKEKTWSLILTFQLALYTTNQRYLDAGCLSNSKQIKEVVSEHIMLRKLWHDEYSGEKYDCKPYKLKGKEKEYLTLDKDKLYVVLFIDKTRNDDNAKCILYKWDSVWNKWTELGYCTIVNDHKGV